MGLEQDTTGVLQYSLSNVIQYVQSLLAPFNLETRDIPEPEMSYLSLT
jgi:hypothetical protein